MKRSREIISPLNRKSDSERGDPNKILLSLLIEDLEKIGLYDPEVEIVFRPYSKTFFGRYMISSRKIYLYPFTEDGGFYSYLEIFETLVHEMVHHLQYTDSKFRRIKGVMHDSDFHEKYNFYIRKAFEKGVL